MMKYFTILLFFFCNCILAQSSDNSINRTNIKANFSMKVLEAYEENSFSKVSDFYQFLEIYSDQNSSETLRNQVKENIYSLYKNNSQVTDFFSSEKITLEKLLENSKAKGLKFEVKNIQKEITSNNFWTNSYSLKISDGKEIMQKKVTQKVYFYPEEKSFGSKKKEVWIILLGDF